MKLIYLLVPIGLLFSSCGNGEHADLDRDHTLNIEADGGTRYLVELDAKGLVNQLAGRPRHHDFELALNECFDNSNSAHEGIENLRTYSRNHPDLRLSRFFNISSPDLFPANLTNDEVVDQLLSEFYHAIEHTEVILEARLVRIPELNFNVYSKGRDIITVEVENSMSSDQAMRLIQSSANLIFYDTYSSERIIQSLAALGEETSRPKTQMEMDTLTEKLIPVNAPVETENQLFKYLMIHDGNMGYSAQVGFAQGKDTAIINQIIHSDLAKTYLPYDALLLWGAHPDKYIDQPDCFFLYCIQLPERGRPRLTGNEIVDAHVTTTNSEMPAIEIYMNAEGAMIWEDWTEEVVGKPIAMVFDNKVYSAPIVNEKISGGKSHISGQFSDKEISDMVTLLNCGSFPVPVKVVDVKKVGN